MPSDGAFARRPVLWLAAGVVIGLGLRESAVGLRTRAAVRVGPWLSRPLRAGLSAPQPVDAQQPAAPHASPPPSSPYAECVQRVEGTNTPDPTRPHDIVLAVLTTAKRHGLIQILQRNWLRDTKALLLTDAPGLNDTELHKVVIHPGDPKCGASDRAGPAIYHANASFRGDFKWILMVDDDVLVSTANLARFLSAYDPSVPLWFSAHGCDTTYVPRGVSEPPCVAESTPTRCKGCPANARPGLRTSCRKLGGNWTSLDAHGFKGVCDAIPHTQGLKTFGSEQGQSYCGGTGCVFSLGFLQGFPSEEITRHACKGCIRGIQDVMLSRCMYHQNPAAVAPMAAGGFFWGRPGERLIEQMLEHYPACATRARSQLATRSPGARQAASEQELVAACVRKHGLMEWFSVHLQVRGAFTTLYRNLVPDIWQSSFRHGKRGIPVPKLLQQLHSLELEVEPSREAHRAAWAARLCCGMLRRAFIPCNLGCTPWRLNGQTLPCEDPTATEYSHVKLAPSDDTRSYALGSLWPEPAERGSENFSLKVHKRQEWPSGVMKCDLCEGYFNGWRGW
ncbi:hypothetical protein AB1Y20_020033 [Prymnesium parvum]|uniref:N-acetylgalactosaminide beta-1,3-galactosyltransferase n=1 Tax=Prymnesium parvum TaxID=97485 RepID=A0AB34JW79_PRYPA